MGLGSHQDSGESNGGGGSVGHEAGEVVHVEGAVVERLHDSVVALATGEGRVASPEVGELSELGVADGLSLLEHGPLDSLGAGRGGQGTVEGPESVGVEVAQESLHVKVKRGTFAVGGGDAVGEHLRDEVVVGVAANLAIEENAEHGAEGSVLVNVDEVHLEVAELAVDGVLTRRVHVELHSLEDALGLAVELAGHLTVLTWGVGQVDLEGVSSVGEGGVLVVNVVVKVNSDVVRGGGVAPEVDGRLLSAGGAKVTPVCTILGIVGSSGSAEGKEGSGNERSHVLVM